MYSRLWKSLSKHLKDNLLLYAIMTFFLFVGIALGAMGVRTLEAKQEGELIEYLNSFINGFATVQIEPFLLIKQSAGSNLKILAAIWFLGLTVLGAPLIFIVLAAKGFSLGFTAGFIIQEKGLSGILLTIFSLLPQNIFNLPAFLAAGVIATTFSSWLFKGRFKNRNQYLIQHFLFYCFILSSLALFILAGSLIEAFVTPKLIKMIIAYL